MSTSPRTASPTLKPARKPTFGSIEQAEIEESRNRARLLFPVESLAHLTRENAESVQRILQHGNTFGIWETRRDWLPPGVQRATFSIDLRERIIRLLPNTLREADNPLLRSMLDNAVLTLVRYFALLRTGPSGKGRDSFRALGPNTVRLIAFLYAPPLMALAVRKRLAALKDSEIKDALLSEPALSNALLSDLTLDDLAPLTPGTHQRVLKECRRMEMLGELGLWWDIPSVSDRSLAKVMTGPALQSTRPSPKDPHQPLPDEYVAEMGSRGLWLIHDLAPNLFRIGETMLEIWRETDKAHWVPLTVRDARRSAVREFLATFEWRDSEGRPFEKPPFPLVLPKQKGFGVIEATEGLRWPPRTYLDIMGLLGTVQSAHLFVAFLSMGGRRSEILSLERTCVVYATDGRPYATGRTFKLVERYGGEMRDWPLPDVAVAALEQQVRLVALAERVGHLTPPRRAKSDAGLQDRPHLWAQISASPQTSDPTQRLEHIGKALISYARALNMDIAPGGQTLRSHRFRKTLARLVALALTQAPRLLMEIFGHKSIEMTLYYILTDNNIRAEIETVSRELRVMRAKEVVEKMVEADLTGTEDLGGYGGPAATAIHNAIRTHREQQHRRGANWEISKATELAELLTLQGKAWEQVRPGVICTKFPGESGPCNKSKGRPEPSKCRSDCGHRLEEAFLREDINGAIHDSLAAYEQAIADDESLTAAHWAAQIRAHVPRFRDLQKKWMDHPTVKALMGGEDSKATA
ncbi:hypothetical protein [Burkholderia cepacia]|uniref:hypothetical protein n=1 Tax=Burkholderia cepacia TaxID=292 RepID=UPI0015759CD4|nr:hypothetical protein [Burkholderia cepacia]